jgi:hypothetical protein
MHQVRVHQRIQQREMRRRSVHETAGGATSVRQSRVIQLMGVVMPTPELKL